MKPNPVVTHQSGKTRDIEIKLPFSYPLFAHSQILSNKGPPVHIVPSSSLLI